MTSETGNRRHPTRAFDAVPVPPDGFVPGELLEFTSYRTLDPVKAAALTAAVQWCRGVNTGQNVLDVADEFEAWLDPKEADAEP